MSTHRTPRSLPSLSSLAFIALAALFPRPALAAQDEGEQKGSDTPPVRQIAWLDVDFAEAKLTAMAHRKPLLFYLCGEGPEDKRMETMTWQDERVLDWVEERVVPVKMTFRHKDWGVLTSFWRIHDYPSVTLTSADGTLLGRMLKFHTPTDFIKSADTILLGHKFSGEVERPEGENATELTAWLAYGNFNFERPATAPEATQAYLWLLDHADEQDPTFLDEQLDFILRRLMNLDGNYGAAGQEVETRFDRLRTLAISGLATDRQALQAMRFVHWLNTGGAFADLRFWDQLKDLGERQEEIRALLYPGIVPDLVAYQRYTEAAKYGGDILARDVARIDAYTKERERIEDPEAELTVDDRVNLDSLAKQLHQECTDNYEILLGVGRGEDAQKLADRFMEVFPTGDACGALMVRALRLELYSVVRRIGEKAKTLVPDSDSKKSRVDRILARIPEGAGEEAEQGERGS
jgi:hypothetical protein